MTDHEHAPRCENCRHGRAYALTRGVHCTRSATRLAELGDARPARRAASGWCPLWAKKEAAA